MGRPLVFSFCNCFFARRVITQINLILYIRHVRTTRSCIVDLMITIGLWIFIDYKSLHGLALNIFRVISERVLLSNLPLSVMNIKLCTTVSSLFCCMTNAFFLS